MLVYAGMGTSLLLPSPAETFLRLRQLLGDPSFYSIIGHTFLRIFSGFLLGTAAGCILGGLTAFSPLLYRFFALPMNAIKSTPVASFVILALVWIKGENLSTFIAFLMVLPVIWQSVTPVWEAPTRNCWKWHGSTGSPVGRNCGTSICPRPCPISSPPCGWDWASAGNRGIAGEVIAIPSQAIGTQLYNAKIYLDMPGLFAWTIVIILLSAAIERVVLFLLPDPKGGDLDA